MKQIPYRASDISVIVYFLFFVGFILPSTVLGQAPEKMTYQAVVRNSTGELLSKSAIGMRISILQDPLSDEPVYQETHTSTSNENGLITITIGDGTALEGTFAGIDWASGPFYIRTEMDLSGGKNYMLTGTQQLMSVPYALYAKTSGSSTPGPQGPEGPEGPQGLVGPVGPQGVRGLDGKTVLNGAANPSAADGTTGDFYFNTSTSRLFGPKTSSGWGTGVSLVGPAGSGVSSVSVVTANGFSGTVANATTTPAITLKTPVTGILKGNGTAITAAAAADFPILNQNTTGNAATVTTNANLTGPVTSVGNATAIGNGVITTAMLADVNTTIGTFNRLTVNAKGQVTAASNVPAENALTFSTGLTRATNTITNNLSTGKAGGQTVIGGTAASENLSLSSTTHATKGKITFGTSAYNETNNRLGIGTQSPSTSLDVVGTVKIADGTQGPGKVLTSDASGAASWQTLAAVTPGSGWSLTGNAGTTDGVSFVGTTDNVPLSFRVNNQKAGRIDVDLNTANTFFGYQSGLTIVHAKRNTAVGYQTMTTTNDDSWNCTAVGAEALNVSRGDDNTAVGTWSMRVNTIGSWNTSVGTVSLVSNTSGSFNTAVGHGAMNLNTTGTNNVALGASALLFLYRGSYNTALGCGADVDMYSPDISNATAIGALAKVNVSNTMVLGNKDVVAWGFGVQPGTAAIRVGTNGTNGNGATLTPGGTWTNASDRNRKENFTPLNGAEVLEKVSRLSISRWNYKEEDPSVSHIGPMAQDFHALFQVGNDDVSISTIDPSGVALAAIQELIKQNNEMKAMIVQLQAEIKSLSVSERKSER